MVRNNFIFFKNINFCYITISIFDDLNNNFIFLRNIKKTFLKKIKFINLKKINSNKQCVNILYF